MNVFIKYCEEGQAFTDFQIKDFFEADPNCFLSYLQKHPGELEVSTNNFIRLVQLFIARKDLDFQKVSLRTNDKTFTFNDKGQIMEDSRGILHFDLAFNMSKSMLQSWE